MTCCPHWLLRDVSRRCTAGACTNLGSGPLHDHHWLDHGVFWIKAGRPAAITSAPYGIGERDFVRIAGWPARREAAGRELRYAFGTGWYGYGTTQVLMWRPDRAGDLAPAAP